MFSFFWLCYRESRGFATHLSPEDAPIEEEEDNKH
jgi:hypothetical protein